MSEQQLFQFIGINSHGRRIRGTLMATARLDLERQLARLNLLPLRVSRLQHRLPGWTVSRMQERYRFYAGLASLMESGIPILQALQLIHQSLLCERGGSGLCRHLPPLIKCVAGGQSLSQAMTLCPHWFPLDHRAVVAAAEQQGHVLDALRELHGDCLRQLTLVRTLKAAAVYPLVLLLVLGGAMAVMLTMVVPSLLQLLLDMGVPLSWHMRLLDWVGHHLMLLGAVFLMGTVLVLLLLLRLPGVSARHVHPEAGVLAMMEAFLAAMLCRLPVVGRWLSLQQRSTFFAHVYRNYQIHADLHQALRGALTVVTLPALRVALASLPEQLQQGICLSDAMLCSGVFSSADIQAIQIAEQSQDLGRGLAGLRQGATDTLERYFKQLQHGIPAALLGIAGTLMAWLVVSVLQPIYSLLSSMPGISGGML